MILNTEVTPLQKRVNEFLEKLYAILCNVFFTGLVLVFLFCLAKPWIIAVVHLVVNKESFDFTAKALWFALLFLLLVVFVLRGLLYLYKFIRATDLMKLYVFVEVTTFVLRGWTKPDMKPTLLFLDALAKLPGMETVSKLWS